MRTINVPTLTQVDPRSKELLEQVQKKLGKTPNLYAIIGYSSSSLKAMMETENALAHNSSFTAKEREAINLIVSQVNNCDYCLAAHTTMAKMRGFSEEEAIAIRKAQLADEKLNNVILLAQSITQNHGKADETILETFFENGYDEKALVELISLITLRSFTNYVFSNTQVPIDFPLAENLA
jgi:alkylhydroperoxidase AhpD family core domain